MTEVRIPTSRGELPAYLATPTGGGFSASSTNYGGCPGDAERLLAEPCPIVGSYGGKDRSPMGFRAGARLERTLPPERAAPRSTGPKRMGQETLGRRTAAG